MMEVSKQNIPVPFQIIQKLFRIPILKIKNLSKNISNYFNVITAYGNMCLIIQQISQNQQKYSLAKRNQLIKNSTFFPFIYEHHEIFQSQMHTNFCLTLIQYCLPLDYFVEHWNYQIKLVNFNKIVRCVQMLEEKGFVLSGIFQPKQLLYLVNSQQISLDITKIKIRQQNVNQQKQSLFQHLIQCMVNLLRKKYDITHFIKQIILIQSHIYTFQPSKLKEASTYQQLFLYMNILLDLQVQIIAYKASQIQNLQKQKQKNIITSPTKIKRKKLRNLEGNPIIKINKTMYDKLHFVQGKCINSFRQIFYQQLANKFVRQNYVYKVQKFQHLIVSSQKNQSKQQKQQQIITVYPPVNKTQMIGFLILYIKCLMPKFKSIQYIPYQNALKLMFIGRKKQQKILRMTFYEQYLLKDQQISMIIEKSSVQNCKLDLRYMNITDSFLFFLSNADRSKQIYQLYLTDNCGISDIGLCSFLKSDLSSDLKTFCYTQINEENMLDQSLQLMSKKSTLTKLKLHKKCKKLTLNNARNDEINVSQLALSQLQIFGFKVNLSSLVKANLKVLRLDQIVLIQQLKNIRHLRLVQLKICLVENQKKSLMQSFPGFSAFTSNKNQPARQFAEGESNKTLKKLDLSKSVCKFKILRPLFFMKQLQQLKLDDCINLGPQYQYIPQKILNLSIANIQLNLQQAVIIFDKITQLVQLNIINTGITKHDIIKIITKRNLYISNLIISQLQFSNKLLDKQNGYQLIECIEVYIQRFLQPEQQYSFNCLISKASQSQKLIRFVMNVKQNAQQQQIQCKKQLIMDKINKFLIVTSTSIDKLQNLYINKMKIVQLLEIQQNLQVIDSCQSYIASTIQISADGCKIVSTPKLINNKSNRIPIIIKALPTQTIDKFTHRFVKFIQKNTFPISVDLSNNKLIDKQIIKIMLFYGSIHIHQLDFRNCIFNMNDVIDLLFEYVNLQEINKGQFMIILNKDNFGQRSHRYLKMFMHLKQVVSLSILCQEIQQFQILNSVLTHILDQSSPTLKYLKIIFNQINITAESQHFIKTLLNLNSLIQLYFEYKQCQCLDQICSQIWNKNLIRLQNIQKLRLKLPASYYPTISFVNLRQLHIEFIDGLAQQSQVYRCIKNLPNLKKLKNLSISLANNQKISNLNRIFTMIPVGNIFQKLSLQYLHLNFQYCPLKQQTLLQLLKSIIKTQTLKILQLNVSFAIINFNDFLNCIESLCDQLTKPIHIKIQCITQNSRNFLYRIQNFGVKGIQIVV